MSLDAAHQALSTQQHVPWGLCCPGQTLTGRTGRESGHLRTCACPLSASAPGPIQGRAPHCALGQSACLALHLDFLSLKWGSVGGPPREHRTPAGRSATDCALS